MFDYTILMLILAGVLVLIFVSFEIAIFFITRTLVNNDSQTIELQLDTHVGCSDGLCYLPMFKSRFHDRVLDHIKREAEAIS